MKGSVLLIVAGLSAMLLSCNKVVDYLVTANFRYINKTAETVKLELYQTNSGQLLKTFVIGVNDSLFLSYQGEGTVTHPFNDLPVDSVRITYGNKKAKSFACNGQVTDARCNEPRNILRLAGIYETQSIDDRTANFYYTFSMDDYAAADSLK